MAPQVDRCGAIIHSTLSITPFPCFGQFPPGQVRLVMVFEVIAKKIAGNKGPHVVQPLTPGVVGWVMVFTTMGQVRAKVE